MSVTALDSINFNVKHPLQHKWTLWYDDPAAMKQNKELTWDENLKQIITISTVEDFWAYLNIT
jgi:translation initiation factor 4E